MSDLVEIKKNDAQLFSSSQIELMKRTIAQGATDDELALFVNQCKRTGLDPFTRQIYFIKDKAGKVTVCSSIDGLRLVAERSDKYEGQTKPEWCDENGVWKDIWLDMVKLPMAARVGVYKTKFREPTYGVALFDEYAGKKDGKLTFMWQKMPALMIAKVAEALALRKAFPNDLSGIYSSEEAELIEATPAEAKPIEAKKFVPTPKPENKPEPKLESAVNPADYVVKVGKKYLGMKLSDMRTEEIEGYIDYIVDGSKKTGKALSGDWIEFVETAEKYLSTKTDQKLADDEINF